MFYRWRRSSCPPRLDLQTQTESCISLPWVDAPKESGAPASPFPEATSAANEDAVIFLRGAGVPDPFMVQMKALVAAMEPIQFYPCLISYNHTDKSFARRVHDTLQGRGIRC